MEDVITLKNVTKKYNDVPVIDNVSLTIHKNEIIGLVGANGAGKSTLISMIIGLKKPDTGNIKILGKNPGNKKVRQKIGVMLQEVSMPEKVKVSELLEMVASFYHDKHTIDYVLKVAGLSAEKNSFVDKLSGGKQRRVQFALSLIGKPDILFLDEPTVGLDFKSKKIFWDEISEMVKNGISIILTSHDLKEIQDISNRIVVLDKGEIKEDNSITELNKKYTNYTITIDVDNLNPHFDLLDKKPYFTYEINNKNIKINTKEINKTVNFLLSLNIGYEEMNIENNSLESVMHSIIGK